MKLKFNKHSKLRASDIILYIMAILLLLASGSMFTVMAGYYDAGITDSFS